MRVCSERKFESLLWEKIGEFTLRVNLSATVIEGRKEPAGEVSEVHESDCSYPRA